MNREEVVNNIEYKLTHAAMEYYRENCTKDISMDEVFEEGAEWMLEQFEEWLSKNGRNWTRIEVEERDDFVWRQVYGQIKDKEDELQGFDAWELGL